MELLSVLSTGTIELAPGALELFYSVSEYGDDKSRRLRCYAKVSRYGNFSNKLMRFSVNVDVQGADAPWTFSFSKSMTLSISGAASHTEYDRDQGKWVTTYYWTVYDDCEGNLTVPIGHEPRELDVAVSLNWYGEDGGSDSLEEALKMEVPAKESWPVTFDANGGEGATPLAQVKWRDEEMAIPECVIYYGSQRFAGWSRAKEGAPEFTDRVPADVNEALDLFAVWDGGVYTLAFDAGGGEGEMEEVRLARDTSYVVPGCAFERPGYDFVGWSLSPGGSAELFPGELAEFDLAPLGTSEAVLHAVWERGRPSITGLACDRSGEGSAKVLAGFELYRAAGDEEADGRLATILVTATPRDASGQAPTIVRAFPGEAQPEAALEIEGLEKSLAYDIEVKVADELDASLFAVAYSMVGTGSCAIDLARGGRGVGVLMRCPEGANGRPEGIHINAEDGMSVEGSIGGSAIEALKEDVLGTAAKSFAKKSHTHSASDIVDGAFATERIDDKAVTTAKLNDKAVTTAKLNDKAVTAEKLGALDLVKTEFVRVALTNGTAYTSGTGMYTVPAGYVPVGYTYFTTNSTYIYPCRIDVSVAGTVSMEVRHISGGAISNHIAHVTVALVRSFA